METKMMDFLKSALDRVGKVVGKVVEGDVPEVAEPVAGSMSASAPVAAKVTTSTVPLRRVDNHSYAHGVYMGAAGSLLADPLWNGILRALMPAQHQIAIGMPHTSALIPYLENNPVMAAYGAARHLESHGQTKHQADPTTARALPMEWDIWLDPSAPTDFTRCRIAHGRPVTTAEQNVLADSHLGFDMPDVAEAPSVRNWMNLFGRAIALYRAAGQGPGTPVETADEAAAIAIAASFMRGPSGLILDCKSTYSTSAELSAFIAALQAAHDIHVIGVGTFRHEQLEQLLEGPRRIKFFHGAAGVIYHAREGGKLRRGDRLMFNAGSLLLADAAGSEYTVDQKLITGLAEACARLELAIGLYVQEAVVAPAALRVITELANQQAALFRDGFAYGNVPGEAEAYSTGSGLGAQSGPALLEAEGI